MDLAIFFENQERIANSLERIADILEARGSAPVAGGHTGAHASPAEVVKKRRTKAEIEADKLAQQTPAAPAAQEPSFPTVEPTPPVVVASVAVATPTVPVVTSPAAVAAPAVAVPVAVPVAAPVAVPVAAAPAAPTVQGHGPEYMGFAVEYQFKELNTLVGPYFQYPHVADTVKAVIAQQGIGMPISNPADRSLPADNYTSLTNEQRYHIYYATLTAIQQFVAANTAQAGI